MTIYQDIKTELAPLLSTALGTAIAETEFTIVGTRAVTGQESVTHGNSNSKIAVQAVEESTLYQGRELIYINRLDLANLRKLSYYNQTMAYAGATGSGLSVYSLLTRLKDCLGARFTVADLEETFTTEVNGFTELMLIAKTNSPSWFGSTKIIFEAPEKLDNAITTEYLATF